MDILQGVNYLYTSNGEQVGPVEGTQLLALAQQGHIQTTDHVWTEGMAEWLPATSFNQLGVIFQTTASQAPVQTTGGVPTLARRGSKPGVKHADFARKPLPRFRKKASLGLYLMFLIFGIALLAAVAWALNAAESNPEMRVEALGGAILIGVIAGVLCVLIAQVVALVYTYRAWAHIQELPVTTVTPGKAVGFLFIPFFNLYWLFIAYGSWPSAFNRYLDMAGATHIPRASSALAITHCVVTILTGPVLLPFMIGSMCMGINNIANLPEPVLEEGQDSVPL